MRWLRTPPPAAPPVAHLVDRGLLDRAVDHVVAQGRHLGRPSRISVRMEEEGGGVWIAGRCVVVATGRLHL